MNKFLLIMGLALAVLLTAPGAAAQTDRREVRAGVRDYARERWREAEVDFRRALVKDSTSLAARYNLASTLYRLGEMDEAGRQLDALKDAEGPHVADIRYNAGNVAVAKKDWQSAVEAYKQALLQLPSDRDAKENYIYAKKMLEKQMQDQQQDQDQQNQNQDQNQDKQDQQKNQDKQDQNQKPQEQPGGQEAQGALTPQQAQQMLRAIEAKEKETSEKVRREKAEALRSRQKEKNW